MSTPRPRQASHTKTLKIIKKKAADLLDLWKNSANISITISLKTSKLNRITIRCLADPILNTGIKVKSLKIPNLFNVNKITHSKKTLISNSFY